MAMKTFTKLIDDLDGANAAGTVAFSFEGASYEIDLSKANAKAFEKAVKPYVDAARKVRGTRTRRASKTTRTHDLAAIRSWAKSAGYQVSDRGRIAASIVELYEEAH